MLSNTTCNVFKPHSLQSMCVFFAIDLQATVTVFVSWSQAYAPKHPSQSAVSPHYLLVVAKVDPTSPVPLWQTANGFFARTPTSATRDPRTRPQKNYDFAQTAKETKPSFFSEPKSPCKLLPHTWHHFSIFVDFCLERKTRNIKT